MRTTLGAIVLGLLVATGCAGPTKPLPSTAVTQPWTSVAAAPIELLEIATAVRDGKIWVAGGLRLDGASDAVLIFDPAAGTWTSGPTLPEAVHHAALVSTPSGLLLIGGYVGDSLNVATAAVRRLDDGATTWATDTPLPDARAAGGAAYDGSRVVYAGGVKPGGVANEVFALGAGSWARIGRLPIAREHLAATSDGAGRTFVLGGRVGSLESNMSVVDVVEGDAVRTVGELPTKRGGVGAFYWPALGACLAGGESPGTANAQVECITADGTVTRLPDLTVARHGVGASVVDGTAYILLGGREPGLFVSNVTESLRLP